LQYAAAASLPEIKTSTTNRVPECATPGRMMRYLKSRNPELNARYASIATEYMRLGEALGVRWDYAFYQMIIETGSLSYRRGNRSGDVRAEQNNFAGLGAIGGGVHGESFKDIATGVRAHLEHLLLYAGNRLENPVAERTRKVQEWSVLTSWQAGIHRPITFSDLADQWAPGSNSYRKMVEAIAEHFQEFCAGPDPQPELVAAARDQNLRDVAAADEPKAKFGAELARQAIADGKSQENEQRSSLGALEQEKPQPVPFTLLNAEQPTVAAAEGNAQRASAPTVKAFDGSDAREPAKGSAKDGVRDPARDLAKEPEREREAKAKAPGTGKTQASDKPPVKIASAAGAAAANPPAAQPSAGQKCRVWTASYGGQKALIIRSVSDTVVNYTVLDVNDGAEKREADAFISAYAKDGAVAGEFKSQSQALDRAFELCPEG
jgi:hypothetical protein